jgi:crotonobetainyl-CoA:carnitine CoA-transferase CaiB-like acyl-CoA transferase
MSTAYWLEHLTAAGIPCSRINTFSEALADPQVAHLGLLADLEMPNGRHTKTILCPILLGNKPPAVRRRPPALGEHNAELLPAAPPAEKS